MRDVEIREATAGEIRTLHGDVPWEIRAWIALYRGQLAAIAGIRTIGAERVVYSEMLPNEAPMLLRVRAARALMGKIRETGLAVMTVSPATGEREYSPRHGRFLELMGFRYSHWDDNRADDPRGCAFFVLR